MEKRYSSTDMISVEEALANILALVRPMPAEKAGLHSCVGRVLAQEAASDIDIAPFSAACMDGFAVRAADLASASAEQPANLAIIGVLGAGAVYDGEVGEGQALRIMTGAPMPGGADTVVKIEDCDVQGENAACPEGTAVSIAVSPSLGLNVREPGEEAKAGEVLLRPGDRISPAAVGLLASTGNAEVAVYGRPHIAIFSTGSELVEPSVVPGPGQIRNSNSYALAAQATEAGALVTILPQVEDTPEAFARALKEAIAGHDMVILSGGAAEGDFDYTTSTVRELGELIFNKVMMRPGKAQTLGVIDGVPVLGLPGNPAAASVGFDVLVRPALLKMQGFSAIQRPQTAARVSCDVHKREPRRFYLRARLEKDASGTYTVTPASNQSSALYRTLYDCNCLLIVPEGMESLKAGDEVSCYRLDLPEGAFV